MNQKSTRTALLVSLIYGLVAGLWILSSEWLMNKLIHNQEIFAWLEIFKGWAFVTLTSVMIFFIIRQ